MEEMVSNTNSEQDFLLTLLRVIHDSLREWVPSSFAADAATKRCWDKILVFLWPKEMSDCPTLHRLKNSSSIKQTEQSQETHRSRQHIPRDVGHLGSLSDSKPHPQCLFAP